MTLETVQFADFTCRTNPSACPTPLLSNRSFESSLRNISLCGFSRMQGWDRLMQKKVRTWFQVLPYTLIGDPEGSKKKVAGWVARTRPLAEPLSPRGPQPVPKRLRMPIARLNGSAEPLDGVPGL